MDAIVGDSKQWADMNWQQRVSAVASVAARMAGLWAVLVSIGAVSLHLCGLVAQRRYLSLLGVDPDGFPRASDWLMMQGYYSTIDRLTLLLEPTGWKVMVVLIVGFALFISVLRWEPTGREPPAWVTRYSPHPLFKLIISSALLSSVGVLFSYLLLVFGLLIFIVPGLAGETAGEKAALRDAATFAAGCTAEHPCTELQRDGVKISSGFILATSLEHVAIYDVEIELVRVLGREGVEIRSPFGSRLRGKKDAAN